MLADFRNKDLNEHFSNEVFVLKTQAQIAKDFATVHYTFPDSFLKTTHTLEDLMDIVQSALQEVIQLGETTLLQLLYTIDIKEADFLSQTTQPDFLKTLSETIIKREAYKIFLRLHFS